MGEVTGQADEVRDDREAGAANPLPSGAAEPTADDLGKSDIDVSFEEEPVKPTGPAWIENRPQPIREDEHDG